MPNTIALARSVEKIIAQYTTTVATDHVLSSSISQWTEVVVINSTANSTVLTIKASDGTTIETIRKGKCVLYALRDSPTTAAHWVVEDVYEEGTYTPTIRTSGGTFSSVTYVTQQGNFSRRHKTVSVQLFVSWSAASGSPAGIVGVTLPLAQSGAAFSALTADFSNLDITTSRTALVLQVPPVISETMAIVEEMGDNVATTNPTASMFNSGSFNKYILASGTYVIN